MYVITATADSGGNTGFIVVLFAALALYWLCNVALGHRNARTCARYGHTSDPKTIGTWRERCARCGARIR